MTQEESKLALFRAVGRTSETIAEYEQAWKAFEDSELPAGSPLAQGLLRDIHDALVACGRAWEVRARGVAALGLRDPGERNAALNDGAQFLRQVVTGYQKLNAQALARGLPRYQPDPEAFRELQRLLSKLDPPRAAELTESFKKEGLPTSGFEVYPRPPTATLENEALQARPHEGDAHQTPSDTVPSGGAGRVLDAAIASNIVKGKATELDVLVRLPDSPGLKGVLQEDEMAEPRADDVQSKTFKMTFPTGRDGRLGPRNATVAIEAPNFHPSKQFKNFLIPPDADSEVLTFLMTPTQTGRLPVLVELHWEEAVRGQRRLRTECVAEAVERPAPAVRTLVQLPIEVAAAPKDTETPDPAPIVAGKTAAPPVAGKTKANASPNIIDASRHYPDMAMRYAPAPMASAAPGPSSTSEKRAVPDAAHERGSREAPESASEGESPVPQGAVRTARRTWSPLAFGTAGIMILAGLGGVLNVALPHILAPKPDPLVQCFQAVLTSSTSTINESALTVGRSLAELVTADSGSGAITLTTTNRSTDESRAISDETVRDALQKCVVAHEPVGHSGAASLPEVEATATVRVRSPSGRPLSNASVQRADDRRQSCTTDESGACDLRLVHLESSNQSLHFVASAKYRRPTDMTATVDEFLRGLAAFQVEAYPSFTVLVTQGGVLVRDKGSVTLDPGAEFPVWSLECQERNTDDDCYTQRIDSQGRAVFYYAKPFEHLSINTVIEGHIGPITTPVLDPKNLPASVQLELASTTAGNFSIRAKA